MILLYTFQRKNPYIGGTILKKFILPFIVLMSVLLFIGCSKNVDEKTKTFYIGGIPDQSQSVQSDSMNELAAILSEATGLDVQYKEVTDYAAVVNGFARDEIQLAWFGGLTGVQARAKVKNSVAVAQRIEDPNFQSIFIAGIDTGIESLTDYKGKSFTFGSESSTSGHLMPRYFLTQAGINPDTDFTGEAGYSGSHDRTIELVANGTFDGGALNIYVWQRYVEEGLIDLSNIKEVEESPEYYDYNFTMRSKEDIDAAYGEGVFDKIVEALLAVDIRNNESLNKYFNSEGFIPANNEQFALIQETAENLGLHHVKD